MWDDEPAGWASKAGQPHRGTWSAKGRSHEFNAVDVAAMAVYNRAQRRGLAAARNISSCVPPPQERLSRIKTHQFKTIVSCSLLVIWPMISGPHIGRPRLHYASPARNGNTIIISDRFGKDSATRPAHRPPPTAHRPHQGGRGEGDKEVAAAGAGGGRVGTSVT